MPAIYLTEEEYSEYYKELKREKKKKTHKNPNPEFSKEEYKLRRNISKDVHHP